MYLRMAVRHTLNFMKEKNTDIFSALYLRCGVFSVSMSDCDGTGNIVRSIDKYAQKKYNYEYEGGKVTHSGTVKYFSQIRL